MVRGGAGGLRYCSKVDRPARYKLKAGPAAPLCREGQSRLNVHTCGRGASYGARRTV